MKCKNPECGWGKDTPNASGFCNACWTSGVPALLAEIERLEKEAEENVAAVIDSTKAALRMCRKCDALSQQLADCNGSCDISLARRQVGPDGIVPGNARECAELWEREAARLSQQLSAWQSEAALTPQEPPHA